MSQADREKWDARYRRRSDGDPYAASELLERALARLVSQCGDVNGLTALDLACGGGRNSIYLAGAGLCVDAVDVSAAGLALARRRAARAADAGAENGINWLQADLDDGLPVSGPYDLIVMIRYLDLGLLADAIPLLNPDGVLIVELHMHPGPETVSGPENPAFLVAPGALEEITRDLTPWIMEEGIYQTGGDRREALARFAGIRSLV